MTGMGSIFSVDTLLMNGYGVWLLGAGGALV